MRKTIFIFIVTSIISAVFAFYGGMKYKENKINSSQSFQNLTQRQRQGFFQENGGTNLRRGTGAGFLLGEVIEKDDKSFTLKTPAGSTRIILFSSSTQVLKSVEGSIGDIEVGKEVMVNGEQNSDGSYNAKTIQLSPRFQNFQNNN